MHVYNTLTFADRQVFREWLGKHGTESEGIWLLFSKKGELVTLSAGDALEEALCHGWIDGQIQSNDENTYKIVKITLTFLLYFGVFPVS